jgi:hypothetical protein
MWKPSSPCRVVDRRHRQAQQLGDLIGRQELVVERDDRVAHDGLRLVDVDVDVDVEADRSGATSRIVSAPTACAARAGRRRLGAAAW